MPYQKFVPGVDPGLKQWLIMRQAAREAKLRGSSAISIIKEPAFKYHKYWIKNLYDLTSAEISEFSKASGRELYYRPFTLQETVQSYEEETEREKTLGKQLLQIKTLTQLSEEELDAYYHLAISSGSFLYLEHLLQCEGLDVNYRIARHQHRTMLHLACQQGDIDKATYLVEELGCDVSLVDDEGTSALHLACHPAMSLPGPIACHVVDQSPGKKPFKPTTAQWELEEAGDVFHSYALVELLLTNDSGLVHRRDYRHGRCPLHLACILPCSLAVVSSLVNHGADASAYDASHRMALDYLHHPTTPPAPSTGTTTSTGLHHIPNPKQLSQLLYRYLVERVLVRPTKRLQLQRVTALQVARAFVSDILRAVLPLCTVCQRSLPACRLLKQQQYRFWLLVHGRFKNEHCEPTILTALPAATKAATTATKAAVDGGRGSRPQKKAG